MLQWFSSRIVWGVLLIAAGLIFLLENLDILPVGDLFWLVLFAIGGLAFLFDFFSNRSHWWSLIPGVTFLSLSCQVGLSMVAPDIANTWGGAVFLGGFGLSFFLVRLANRAQWWAIIPGGLMLSLAVVSVLEETGSRIETGGVFLLGLAITFALVALFSADGGPRRWPWIPAGILGVIGLLSLLSASSLSRILIPLLLILVGVIVVFRAFVPVRKPL